MAAPIVPAYTPPLQADPSERRARLFRDEWLLFFNALRLQSAAVLTSPFSLGGSDFASVPMDPVPAYTPVPNTHYFYASGSFVGVVRAWIWARNPGVAVRARLYDMTDAVAVGTSSLVTATSRPALPEAFNVTITQDHFYRLDIITDTASEDGYGIGDLYAA